ncbi:hypothetical protein ACWEPC_27935 [Nonomuraea sp. NPDC004297]
MFKRRLAVLGTVAVLAVTGLAGSAMADEPAPVAGTKVTCTTPDGKTVELTMVRAAKVDGVVSSDGKVARVAPDGVAVTKVRPDELPEGAEGALRAEPLSPEQIKDFAKTKPVSPEDIEKVEVFSAEEAEKFAKARPLPAEEAEKLAKVRALTADEIGKAMPARPAEPAEKGTAPEGVPGKALSIHCVKAAE